VVVCVAGQSADALLAQAERERESIQWLAGALGGAGISIGIGVTVAGVGDLRTLAAGVGVVAMIATFAVFGWTLMTVFKLLKLDAATGSDQIPESEPGPDQKATLGLFHDDRVRQVQAIAQATNRAQASDALGDASSRAPDLDTYSDKQRAAVRRRLKTFVQQATSGGDAAQAERFTDLIAEIDADEQELAAWQRDARAERQAKQFLESVRAEKAHALRWLTATIWVAGANLALALTLAVLPAAQPGAKPLELSSSTIEQLTPDTGKLELDPSTIERLTADTGAIWVDAWLDPADDQRLADERGVSREVTTGCTLGKRASIGAWLLSGTPEHPRLLLFEAQVDEANVLLCEPAFFAVPDGSKTFVVPTRSLRRLRQAAEGSQR